MFLSDSPRLQSPICQSDPDDPGFIESRRAFARFFATLVELIRLQSSVIDVQCEVLKLQSKERKHEHQERDVTD
jgi:hypothetical protein